MSNHDEPQIPEFGTPEFEEWWESQYYAPIESLNIKLKYSLQDLEWADGFVGK